MYKKKHRFEDLHPLRWRRSRPFSGALLRLAADHSTPTGTTHQFFQLGVNAMMPDYNPAIMKLPFEKRPENPLDVMMPEITIGMYASAFWMGNRNVVALDPSVMELIRHTDADNVPMSAIRWTHPLVYVALPDVEDISFTGMPNVFDGAYVDTRIPDHVQIALTTRRLDVETRRQTWPLSIEPVFTFARKVEEGETVADFVRLAVEERVASLLSSKNEEERRKAVDLANADPEIGHAVGRHFESVGAVNNARRADEVEENSGPAARALALVVNLMCYLSTEPEMTSDFSPRPPLKLREMSIRGTPKQKERARKEMASIGILPIMVAGRGSQSAPCETDSPSTGRTTCSHWRRGYYNTYWTGTGRTIPRIRWIRPQVINGHQGDPVRVHVHPVMTRSGNA